MMERTTKFLLLALCIAIVTNPTIAKKTKYKNKPDYRRLQLLKRKFKGFYLKKEFQKASQMSNKLNSLAGKVYGNNHPILSFYYTYTGRAYYGARKYRSAVTLFHKSLQINQANRRRSSSYYARDYSNLGNVYFHLKKYKKSILFFQKALQLRIRSRGKYHNSVATLYSNLGSVYEAAGNKKKALEYYEKSLSVELYNFKRLTEDN
ncbi:MAG: tetratricopeptide repeat protein [Spirochaetota bacterium]